MLGVRSHLRHTTVDSNWGLQRLAKPANILFLLTIRTHTHKHVHDIVVVIYGFASLTINNKMFSFTALLYNLFFVFTLRGEQITHLQRLMKNEADGKKAITVKMIQDEFQRREALVAQDNIGENGNDDNVAKDNTLDATQGQKKKDTQAKTKNKMRTGFGSLGYSHVEFI